MEPAQPGQTPPPINPTTPPTPPTPPAPAEPLVPKIQTMPKAPTAQPVTPPPVPQSPPPAPPTPTAPPPTPPVPPETFVPKVQTMPKTPPPQPVNPTPPVPPAPKVEMKPQSFDAPYVVIKEPKSHKGLWVTILILVILAAAGWAYYTYYPDPYNPMTLFTKSEPTPEIPNEVKAFDDADLRLEYVPIPSEQNSALVFSTTSKNFISKTDADYLRVYFAESTTTKPVWDYAKAKGMVKNNAKAFALIDEALNKKEYQCSIFNGEECDYSIPWTYARLLALRARLNIADKNYSEAKNDILKIISIGRRMVNGSDEAISMLVGLGIEKLGTNTAIFYKDQSKESFVFDDKALIRQELRGSFKRVLRYLYTRQASAVDYIGGKIDKPLGAIDTETLDTLNLYRNQATSTNWNLGETKKLFYDSFKIALNNIDLPCTATSTESKKVIFKDAADMTAQKNSANFVGKTLYSTIYASFDTVNSAKFCEFDTLIDLV